MLVDVSIVHFEEEAPPRAVIVEGLDQLRHGGVELEYIVPPSEYIR